MKLLLVLAFSLFVFNSCSVQHDSKKPTDENTNSLYPSPSLVIPQHSEWTKTHYKKRIAEFKANPLQTGDIVFIGNSITEQAGNWGERFGNPKIKNRGIAGDVTAGVIARLKEIQHYKPTKIFLKIGINDLFNNDLSAKYVAENIKLIVSMIHKESPKTIIYIQTVLPTVNNNPLKEKIAATNAILKAIKQTDFLQLIDLHTAFADKDGFLIKEYSTDGLHINEAGYKVWQNYIEKFVK